MNSIHGFSNNTELMLAQLTALRSPSPNTSQAAANSLGASSDPTDTVQLSLNQIRDEFQNARISYNEKQGNLTGDQASQLQSQIAAVEQQVSADEQANSGPLTSAQKDAINQMQNQISAQIAGMAHTITTGTPDPASAS